LGLVQNPLSWSTYQLGFEASAVRRIGTITVQGYVDRHIPANIVDDDNQRK
jgi:hypothetical protein